MSSAEKRHFHKTVRGGKDAKYVQLFNAISNQKVYKEVRLIKKFGYENNLNNFSAAKNRLFKLVLKSLREFSSHFGDYQKILQHLKDIEILYTRGLWSDAMKSTQKAREIAEENVWPVLQLLVEHWEQMLSDVNDLNNVITPLIGHSIDTRLQYETLYRRIYRDNLLYSSFSYHQNPKHCYLEVVGHELMQRYSSVNDNRSKWYFCLIKMECCRTLRNTADLSKWGKELLRVQQSMTSNGFYNEGWRLKGIYEYLHSLLDNYEIDLFLKDFHLIKDLECPLYKEDLLRAKIRDSLVLETYLLVISNKSKKTLEQLVSEVEAYVEMMSRERLHGSDLMLMVGVQYLFYASRKDDMAVKWAALFDQMVDRKTYIKHYTVSQVMSMLSHYGLGNDIYIKNTLPSLERFIKKHDRLNSEFVFLFRLLNKLVDTQVRKEKELLLHVFKADMKTLKKTNRKNHLLSAHSLMVWADNCLSNERFIDTNRELFAPDL